MSAERKTLDQMLVENEAQLREMGLTDEDIALLDAAGDELASEITIAMERAIDPDAPALESWEVDQTLAAADELGSEIGEKLATVLGGKNG